MHTVQKNFLETAVNAKDFMVMVRGKVHGRNPEDIINMD